MNAATDDAIRKFRELHWLYVQADISEEIMGNILENPEIIEEEFERAAREIVAELATVRRNALSRIRRGGAGPI